MTEQGELETQIQNASFVPIGYEKFDFNGNQCGRIVIDVQALRRILDEAKADFYKAEGELKEEWFAERDSEFRQKIMTKIEKWFGSEAPQK